MKFITGILFLLFLIFSYHLTAQELTGVITDADTPNAIAGVLIENITTGAKSFSANDGAYKIKAQSGEVVEFSLTGYKTVTLAVPPSVNGVSFRRISMQSIVYSLEEVEIVPGFTKYQVDSLERRRTYANDLNRVKERSPFSPFTAIADNISRKSRTRWRFQKNFAKWEDENFSATRYTPEMVSDITGLDGNILFQFMAAYPINADYARVASDLEIKMWVMDNYRNWMKKPEKERIIKIPESILEK